MNGLECVEINKKEVLENNSCFRFDSEYFNKQEGQLYPISNQIVVCGFISPFLNDWKKFVKQLNKEIILRRRRFEVVLSNNELTLYFKDGTEKTVPWNSRKSNAVK